MLVQVPGVSAAMKSGAGENDDGIADADTAAVDAEARSIDFTLDDKTGLFQVPRVTRGLVLGNSRLTGISKISSNAVFICRRI